MRAALNTDPAVPREAVSSLSVGGLEKLSIVDWPGQLSAVVFCQGCAWRCSYCHNPHLIPFARSVHGPTWDQVLAWLGRRRGLLDGVVFSGGEPIWQPALPEAVRKTRELGFRIGLHTGGPSPERLTPLLPFLDWVGFDFKATFSAYAQITGRDDGAAARLSLELLLAARIPCEIRTTWHPLLLPDADLERMADTLIELGCTNWVIQRFRPDGCADSTLAASPVGEPPLAKLRRDGLLVAVR